MWLSSTSISYLDERLHHGSHDGTKRGGAWDSGGGAWDNGGGAWGCGGGAWGSGVEHRALEAEHRTVKEEHRVVEAEHRQVEVEHRQVEAEHRTVGWAECIASISTHLNPHLTGIPQVDRQRLLLLLASDCLCY